MNAQVKIIKTATVALSLDLLLKGQLKFLNKHFTTIALSGNDAHLDTVAKREGVKTISVGMVRPISLFKDILSLIQLYRVFCKEKPTIVHSITPKAGLLSMIAAYFAKVPIRVHTFTGLIFPYKKGILKKLLVFTDRLLCQCATHVFAEGQGVKNDLLAFNITNKPLSIIANGNINGIDTAYFNPNHFTEEQKQNIRTSLNIPQDAFVYVFVGRLVADKGINELVEAFLALSNQAQIVLLLVGPQEPSLDPLKKDTLQKIEQSKNIISIGFQQEVRSFFAIGNTFVFPSYREGFPNVVLQAGAMGLPAIVTNINGSNEIIKHLYNGLIIPVKNREALKLAMLTLFQDKTLHTQLAKNARPIIEEKFKQETVWEALLKNYNTLIANV